MKSNSETKETKLSFRELIELQEVKDKFKEMLGENNGVSFLYSALQVVEKDFGLRNAEPESILNAVSAIASINLMIDPSFGQAFIKSYKVKEGNSLIWKTLAQFQIGYKGLIELGHRSNQFKRLNSVEVREGEFSAIDRMTGDIDFNWNQDQNARKKLPVIGYVAFFRLANGFEKSFYMTMEEMKEHGKKWSETFKDKDSIWNTDFDGAGKKTVLKLLLDKYAPKSTEMQRAIKFDQAIIEDIDGNKLEYVDNPNKKEKVDMEANNKAIENKRFLDHIKNAKTIEKLKECEEHIEDEMVKKEYQEKLDKLKSKK